MSVMKFLDIEGLSTFLNQIKNKFVSKENIDNSLSSSSTNPVQNKVINTALGNKVDKVDGKQLSTNDYTTTEKNKLSGIEDNANNYIHPSTHPASMITQDSTHRFVTDVEKQMYEDKYTKNEVDNKLSALETKIDWKESVETYDDIETTYPSPEDGWTVNVNDTDITYRYDGTSWIAISANSIPLATSNVDGKMSKTDKAKLDGIASGANNYVHPTYTSRTSGLYKVTVDSTGHISDATAVAKSDITALGIPAQDTTYSAAGSGLGLVKSGGDVTISDGIITVNDDSHNHTIANIDGLQDALDNITEGTVSLAEKATADSEGQNIADTYIKGLSVSGRTITYTKGDGDTGTITTQDTTYTHPNSGVSAGTYKSVTVNEQGHVTAGSNPTTLAGYGITDACKLVYQTSEPSSGLVANMIWIG